MAVEKLVLRGPLYELGGRLHMNGEVDRQILDGLNTGYSPMFGDVRITIEILRREWKAPQPKWTVTQSD